MKISIVAAILAVFFGLVQTFAKKHIITLVLDDIGRADTQVYGDNGNMKTPNLVQLAKNGVVLDNFYTQSVCTPTRVALLTGRYPFRTGMQHRGTQLPGMWAGVPYSTPMLAEYLTDYESHMIGKHHVGYATWRHTPMGRGFKSFFGYLQGRIDYFTHKAWLGLSEVKISCLDFWKDKQPLRSVSGEFSVDLYQNRLKEVLRDYTSKYDTKAKQANTPLFLYYAQQLAHDPYQPRKDEARCNGFEGAKRIYCSMVVELDDTVGELVTLLKDFGLWEDTFLFVMTDNGALVKWSENPDGTPAEFSGVGSNYPLRGAKATLFEGGVRSLAMISGGAIPAGKRGTLYKGLAHVVDFTATILKLAEQATPLLLDGYDLFPSMFKSASFPRDHVPINIIDKGKEYSAVRFGTYKLIVKDNNRPAAGGWFGKDGELIEKAPADDDKKILLFDLAQDPQERNNIAPSNPNLVQRGLVLIQSYVLGDYFEPQGGTLGFNLKALPIFHNGVCAPFMSEEEWKKKWERFVGNSDMD